MMIGVKVDSEWLELQGVKIRLHLLSPLFEPDFIKHSYTYPIRLPWTPLNARLMRFYEREANSAEVDAIPCQLFLAGLYYRDGQINYRGYTGGIYDIDITIAPAPVIQTFTDKPLKELVLGGNIKVSTPLDTDLTEFNDIIATPAANVSVDDGPYCYAPIRNSAYLGDKPNFIGALAGDVDLVPPIDYVNYFDPAMTYPWMWYKLAQGTKFSYFHYTALPFIVYVLTEMFAENGYELTGDILADPEVRTQVVITNHVHTNYVEGVALVHHNTDTDGEDYIRLANYLPNQTCIEMMIAAQKRYNGRFIFTGPNTVEFRSMNAVLTDTAKWDITDRVQPISDDNFEHQEGFALSYVPEAEDAVVSRIEDIDESRIIGTVDTEADLSGLSPILGDLAIVRDTNYIWHYTNVLSSAAWERFTPNLFSEVPVDNGQDLDVGVALTAMYRGEDDVNGGRDWLVPHMAMTMYDPQLDWHGLGYNPASKLRLLYHRGLQQDSNGDTYPLLSSEVFNYNGDVVTDAVQREVIDGEDGIRETWWAKWLTTLGSARPSIKTARLEPHEIITMRFDRRVRIRENDYLVRSLDVEVTIDSISLCKLDSVRIPAEV